MLTYSEAQKMMQRARHGRRKLENNTYLETRYAGEGWAGSAYADGRIEAPHYAVRLHQTDVVTLHPDGTYTLSSGGWRTVTTKDRINRYSPAILSRKAGEWCLIPPHRLSDWDNPIPYEDGIRIGRDGLPIEGEI